MSHCATPQIMWSWAEYTQWDSLKLTGRSNKKKSREIKWQALLAQVILKSLPNKIRQVSVDSFYLLTCLAGQRVCTLYIAKPFSLFPPWTPESRAEREENHPKSTGGTQWNVTTTRGQSRLWADGANFTSNGDQVRITSHQVGTINICGWGLGRSFLTFMRHRERRCRESKIRYKELTLQIRNNNTGD